MMPKDKQLKMQVKLPEVHPGENARFQRYPLRDGAKVLRPEADMLFIGYLRYAQLKFGSVSGYEVVLCLCCHGYVSVNKKRQRRWLAYEVIKRVWEGEMLLVNDSESAGEGVGADA